MMASYPSWFDEMPVWEEDQRAYQSLATSSSAHAQTLHRAVRHHHWRKALAAVQEWTRHPWDAPDKKNGDDFFWQTQSLTTTRTRMRLVNHLLVKDINDAELQESIRNQASNQALILREAQKWQRRALRRNAKRPVWLTDKAQADALNPFTKKGVHALVAALGLWHFGEMAAEPTSAVLRLEYEVDEQVPLFKPDWRHGHPHFYWAQAPHSANHGLARDLRTGQQICKEWVVPLEQLANRLVAVDCIVPEREHNHHELSDAYWLQVETEIRSEAGGGAP